MFNLFLGILNIGFCYAIVKQNIIKKDVSAKSWKDYIDIRIIILVVLLVIQIIISILGILEVS